MYLTVVLGASSEASFDILLNDNSFTQKWVNELKWCLNNCDINQHEAFSSFLTLEEATDILKQSCATINSYLKNFIEIREDIGNQPQEYFNYLHSKFEQISGNYGNPSRLFSIAKPELKDAIRNLNFYIHRVEAKREPYTKMYISFDKNQYRRVPLSKEDYEYFEFTTEPGTLFLHYAELGKDFAALYHDGLELNYSGFKNLHYYSGEATLAFKESDCFADPKYVTWLTNQGIDPYNKQLGHGMIPLGKVDNIESAKDKLRKYRHINTILIKENNHGKTI
jgi:hypothetical protein